jgi:peptidoglycan/xylan/chitin deacetylase (PgdA/CDA1 family)
MFAGKMKALTFSYDDGVLQDKRLIDIFNKYNLKATFNLNSERFGLEGQLIRGGKQINHTKVNAQDVKTIYGGHEVAAHTLTHPNLCKLEKEEIIRQVEQDRLNLSQLVGYDVCGMAYPGGGTNNNEFVAETIYDHTNVKYARTIECTYSFDIPNWLYQLKPTVYHMEFDKMFELGECFLDLQADKPQIYYIWGHSYEFDIDNTWDKFEEFCKMMSGRDDIFYGTNRQVFGL